MSVGHDNFPKPVNREYHRRNFLHLVYVENDRKENRNCSLFCLFLSFSKKTDESYKIK